MSDQEIKKDAGKNRLDLIPVECIEALGKVLTMGAAKYHDNSWREGINYSRVYAATQRHLQAFWGEGPDIDSESTLPHLYHAMCNIAFLITYEATKERYRTFDDRPGSNNEFYKQREELVRGINKLVQDNPSFFECKVGDDTLQKAYETLDYAIHNTDDGTVEESPDFPDLTKMTNEEACNHLKPGMNVRVLRSASAGERGWANIWTSKMDDFVGKTYVVDGVNTAIGVCFIGDYWGSFPAFVLEIVSGPEDI